MTTSASTHQEKIIPCIALDAMGGDCGLEVTVGAAAELSLKGKLTLLLVGDAREIGKYLDQQTHNPEYLSVLHTTEVAPSDKSPQEAIKAFPNASILKAMRAIASGKADALVTAGNPGVAVLAAKQNVPMMRGVSRAALGAVVPTARRRGEHEDPFCLVLDVGATIYASAEELVSFALMGAAYSSVVGKNKKPKVALLSNNKSPVHAPPAVQRAHAILSEGDEHKHLDFMGVIEGHQLPSGEADVVVCEGFTGNIAMKLVEGIAESAVELVKAAYESKLKWRLGISMLSGRLEQLRRLTDWKQYGGAPLLGFQSPIIITHSRSGKRALMNAIRVAARGVREGVVEQIQANLDAFYAEDPHSTKNAQNAEIETSEANDAS